MADSLGVPGSWLDPVADLLNEFVSQAPANITRAYLDKMLANMRARVPELFGNMNTTALAEVLEAGMGEAVIEGARKALRKATK